VFVADATHSIQSILSGGQIQPGDLILVTGATADSDLTLGASASGIAMVGLDGVAFGHGITINGANGVTIRNLDIAGPVSITGANAVNLAEDIFRSKVTIANDTAIYIRDSAFPAPDQGLVIAGASNGEIFSNVFAGSNQDLVINAQFTGSITGNDISGAAVGVVYGAPAALSGNRIHNNATGVTTAIADPGSALGFFPGSALNDIYQNTLGIQSTGALVAGQRIFNNTTGVSGSGTLGGGDVSGGNFIAGNQAGGSDMAGANFIAGNLVGGSVMSSGNFIAGNQAGGGSMPGDNLGNFIAGNQTGVGAFTGLVRDNRIEANGIGINATTGLRIFNNQLVSNTTAAILASGVTVVEIAGNTIRAFTGDGIRINNQSTDVEVISNIIWSDSGYGIYVANDSQAGFWSDYNTLYADGTGKIVYWTKDFYDILDWQDDVARFDLHSDGATVVNPHWAEPHFGMGLDGILTTRPVVVGQRLSDPTTSGGDPAGSFIGYRGIPNLIVNGSFENGLTGWTFTPGGIATSGGPPAWDGSSVFVSGSAANAVAQQTVDLVAAGFSATTIDTGGLQVAFGGRVTLSSSAVTAQISLVFKDQNNVAIGNPIVVPAGTDLGRWLRAFETVYIPAGARTVQFLFSVSKTDASNGAALDAAFLGIIPRGTSVSQGDVPAAQTVPLDATNGRLALRSPDLYVDWELNTPKFITWDSFGVAAGSSVRIELWQDGPSGPAFRSLITASTPDTGRFAWTPSSSGLNYGTYGLHIRISLVTNPNVYDMSSEPFTVPESGNTYYVNDNSTTGDQYTTAVGANRNDGKLPSAPKPNPVNLFRTYDVTGGANVYIDNGSYPLIDMLQLSGSVDRGLGLDTAFAIHGPTNQGATATLFTAVAGARPPALIDLLDANFVTLDHLTLQGGVEGLYVHGGSDTFSASYLTATGQSGNAFDITTNSPSGVLDHLTAMGAGGEGLLFSGTIQAITHYNGIGNSDGLVVSFNGSIGSITDSTFSNNQHYGLHLSFGGSAVTTLEGNAFSGNSTGAYLVAYGNGGGITFGNANLSLNRGNLVFGNTYQGVQASQGTVVVGNTMYNNSGGYGLRLVNGATGTDNVVFGNAYGIDLSTGTVLQGNRVYNNSVWGINATDGSTVLNNVVYSNGVGV
jgi:hypothetical protein